MRGTGVDLLVVCGFAFDPHSGVTAKEFAPGGDGFAIAADERRLGKLRVLLARMNPDLSGVVRLALLDDLRVGGPLVPRREARPPIRCTGCITDRRCM